MPWHQGEPPKDGRGYVCETPSYDGPIVLRWFEYNGTPAFRDWDADPYSDITRWHDLIDGPYIRISPPAHRATA